MPLLWIGLLAIGGLAALAGGLTLRRKRIRYPDPKSYITDPDAAADVTVKRLDNGDYELCWTRAASPVKIFAGTHPDTVDLVAPLDEVVDGQSTTISGLDATNRYYFVVMFADGQRVMASTRFLPLAGAVNFRDMGGFKTADGKRVCWGKLFRSGSLGSLTSADYEYIERIGIKLVCDLRSSGEIAVEPDKLPASIEYVHASIFTDSDSVRRLRALLVDPRALSLLMLEMYTHQMIDQNARPIGDILRRLSNSENLPALIHCTAGKDRTGITAAVLLSVLGVPDVVITADYSLSNHYFETIRQLVQNALPQRLAMFGITIDDMQVLLTANPVVLQDALNYLRQRYGSVEVYLRDAAGVDDSVIERLKTNLLEAV